MKPTGRLATYRAKRDPARTPEPFGGESRHAGGRLFMVHKHAARRLHYDLRLEMGGVVASWAVPKGPGWLFEIKYDGVRVLAIRREGTVKLCGRSGQLTTGRYPEVARALAALPVDDFVLDGEIIALDEDNRPSFQLRGLPLHSRKECLALFVPKRGIAASGDHVTGQGAAFFDAVCAQGLEGVMAKRAGSPYTAARTGDWLKIKCHRRQEFVIGGYTKPQGSRARFGALHLGVWDKGRLVYVGKVGTGFSVASLETIYRALAPLERPTSPFDVGAPAGRGHHWVEPTLVAEVRFSEWTRDGGIRHPAFLGLRTDKAPETITREEPGPAPRSAAPAPKAAASLAQRVRLTNLAKVFWPDEGYTKGDLIAYYDAVAPLILPYLRDRPLVLTRYPDGISGKSFFQKDAPPFTPDWIRTASIHSDDASRDIAFLLVDDADGLRYVANSGAIPIHLWASRLGSLDRPDWLVLDLDPKGAPFAHVVKVARALHDLLEGIDQPSYVKTSGATGLHILLPLGARHTYEQARGFARLLAMLVVQAAPDIATVARSLRSREGKVYVDWGQNGKGQTIAAPFSARPRPGATVSCPLAWAEVTARLDPGRFTIKTVPARFAAMMDPLAPVLGEGIDMAVAIAALERRATTLRPARGARRER